MSSAEVSEGERNMSSIFGGGGDGKVVMPVATAQQAKKQAEPVTHVSEEQKKNLRLAAAFFDQDWDNVTLGKAALLGIPRA